jgi:lipoprotein-anchoring transpeptidase ErfK/SrfK
MRKGLLVGVLIVALALVAVGSDLIAARVSQTSTHHTVTNTQPALFDTSISSSNSSTPVATPTPTPKPDCHCTPSKTTLQSCEAPTQMGQVIIVCESQQWLYAYQDKKLVFNSAVETGRPELPTPAGVFSVLDKACSDLLWMSNAYSMNQHNSNCTEHNGDGFQEVFTSPFPPGSPEWYYPTHINYAMEFDGGGFFLHDAWWHCDFGPGSNVDHYTPGCPGWVGGHIETGSHGCVGMSIPSAAWLYSWTHIGTTVIITY